MIKIQWIFFLCSFPPSVLGYTGSNVNDVITQLFVTDGYNNKIRPVIDQSARLDVIVEFFLNSVIGFDEQDEVLTTSGYLMIYWLDQYLTWTPSSFNGTTEIFLSYCRVRMTFRRYCKYLALQYNLCKEALCRATTFPQQQFYFLPYEDFTIYLTSLEQQSLNNNQNLCLPKGVVLERLHCSHIVLDKDRDKYLPQDDIWKPDISLRNTFKSFKGLGSSYLNVRVDDKGQVLWMPFQILQSTCAVDIKYFPFDKQLCDIKFTAWSYSKFEIDLNAGTNGVTLEDYSPNAQWELTNTYYKEVNTEEAAVIFQIELKRKSAFYIINIIAPVILLSILNVCTFLLPVASGEKAGYSVTVFLSLAVFLTIVASELPKNSDVVSLMSIYLTLMSLLSTFIVALSLLQIRLSVRCTKQMPINGFFMFLIKFQRFLRCQSCDSRPASNMVENLNSEDKKSLSSMNKDEFDWSDVNDAIDFVSFWLSLLYTFLCTVTIFGISVSQ